jgi:PEP-CTERM motif
MLRNRSLLIAALAGIALLFATSAAPASTITITVTDGTTQTITASSATGVYTFTANPTTNFTGITGTVTTTDNTADPTMSTLSVNFTGSEKSTASAGSHLLTVKVTDSNFVTTSGRMYDTSSGGIATASGTITLSHTSVFDGAPPLTEGPVTGTGAAFLTPATGQFTATGTALTIMDTTKITTNKKSETFSSNATSQANLIVPEPASMAMALGGLGILGVGTWVRRRKVKM